MWEGEVARQVFPESHWDLRFCVAVCGGGKKETGSRDGMRATKETSPYHAAWIEQCRRDLPEALRHLGGRDLDALGALAERNALRMHADALAADPPLLYWQPATVACLQALRELRARGCSAWGTIDAGPHVVAFCEARDSARVEERLRKIAGVESVLVSAPAGGARLLP